MASVEAYTTEQAQFDHTTPQISAAFHRLKPITPDYALLPILEGFNWVEALAGVEAGAWYLVVFRSLRTSHADVARLTEFDGQAHHEALAGSGLLFYFQGQVNLRRECLSFCVWHSREQAQMASSMPLHQAAAGIVGEMYESYRLERYLIRKAQSSGAVTIERVTG